MVKVYVITISCRKARISEEVDVMLNMMYMKIFPGPIEASAR